MQNPLPLPVQGQTTDLPESDLPALRPTPPGRYRHYKGNFYEVIDTVRHSETLEPMTLYRALYGERGLWVRPAAMFEEEIVFNGVRQARFAKVDAANAPGRSGPSPAGEGLHGPGQNQKDQFSPAPD